MDCKHDQIVERQFGPQAKAYVESAVHAQGPDLEALESLLQAEAPTRLLDVGAGGGHVSYLAARYATTVVAADLSREMLDAVAAVARQRGLTNIETVPAVVEALPFAEGEFDTLACRYSAHHWRDFNAGLREARRVLKEGSRALFIDACSPGPALFDTHLQAVELLRDASHVRDYSVAEWPGALADAGFVFTGVRHWRIRMDFPAWTARMRTPAENIHVIRALQMAAAEEVQRYFAIEPDGSFMLDIALFESRAR